MSIRSNIQLLAATVVLSAVATGCSRRSQPVDGSASSPSASPSISSSTIKAVDAPTGATTPDTASPGPSKRSVRAAASAAPADKSSEFDVTTQYWKAMAAGRKATVQGRLQDAIKSFDDALELHPGDARAQAERGYAHLKAEEWDLAIADLDAAASATDDTKILAAIWHNYGLVARGRDETELAEAAFERARALRGDPPEQASESATREGDAGGQSGADSHDAAPDGSTPPDAPPMSDAEPAPAIVADAQPERRAQRDAGASASLADASLDTGSKPAPAVLACPALVHRRDGDYLRFERGSWTDTYHAMRGDLRHGGAGADAKLPEWEGPSSLKALCGDTWSHGQPCLFVRELDDRLQLHIFIETSAGKIVDRVLATVGSRCGSGIEVSISDAQPGLLRVHSVLSRDLVVLVKDSKGGTRLCGEFEESCYRSCASAGIESVRDTFVDAKTGTVRLDIVQPRVDGHEPGDVVAVSGGWFVSACDQKVGK